MNANEREAIEEIRERAETCSDMPSLAEIQYQEDVGKLLTIIDRHERLANEGLTDDERQSIARVGKLVENNPYLEINACRFLFIIAKIQAQLTAALDRITKTEGIASDALQDKGLQRIAEVREETARECARLAFDQGATNSVQAIRRRFGLAAPQPAKPPPSPEYHTVGPQHCTCLDHVDRTCPYHRAMREANARQPAEPAEVCQRCPQCDTPMHWSSQYDRWHCRTCRAYPAETVCQRCNGTRSINTGPGDYGDEYIPCPDCSGRTDDRRSVRRCLEDRP